jgi:type VI secretion system secreted protein VgrG
MALTQDNRPLRVTTGLGKDVLLLERFSGEEGVSTPFRFTLEMLSDNASVDPASLLRKPISVAVVIPGGKERHFHGIVNRFSAGARRAGLTSYKAEMVPWLWFLTLRNDCRIFQNQTAKDIVEKIFKDLGYTDFKFKLMGSPPKRTYCVQYRESSLAFVSRLLEEEGIFYFFDHTGSSHMLVLTDHPSQVPPCPQVAKLRMTTSQSYQMAEEPLVTAVEMETVAVTEKIELTSYDFEKPSTSLRVNVSGTQKDEAYDYAGTYTAKSDGDRYARMRLEQRESERELLRGECNSPSFTSGHKFDLTEHTNKPLNQSYHLLRVRHAAMIPNYTSGSGEYDYSNTFEAIPSSVPWRPPLVTPRALVQGSQTAVVVGPGGEEIYVDKFGRVKVQFHWDREGKKDEKSSCWVRVATSWAGKNWGMVHIPRIGQEVVVDFLEGDPDRPIITGSVPNAEQMPPYALPGNMTQSGILTRSSKGGSAANANEIRFEDKKGSEELYIHAEKDEKHGVENDRTKWVGHDETVTVDNDRTEHVKHDESITVDNNRTETVGNNESLSIGNNRTTSVGNDESVSVGGSRSTSVGGDDGLSVGGGHNVSVSKDETINVAGNQSTDISKNQTLEIAEKRSTNVGKDDELKVGKKLTIVVADQIQLKTGDASITMKKNGTIEISGKDITIAGSGKIKLKADSDVAIKGSKITQN